MDDSSFPGEDHLFHLPYALSASSRRIFFHLAYSVKSLTPLFHGESAHNQRNHLNDILLVLATHLLRFDYVFAVSPIPPLLYQLGTEQTKILKNHAPAHGRSAK